MNPKQPQFTERQIATPLWFENARDLHRAKARWHRKVGPWLLIVAVLALAQFVFWFITLP